MLKKFIKIASISSSIIIDYLLPIVLVNLGVILIPDNILIGVAIIVLAFLIFYFTRNTSQIKTNQNTIKELKNEISTIKKEIEIDRKLLNTLKDILLLRSIKKKDE